jgi:Single-strand binding protein family
VVDLAGDPRAGHHRQRQPSTDREARIAPFTGAGDSPFRVSGCITPQMSSVGRFIANSDVHVLLPQPPTSAWRREIVSPMGRRTRLETIFGYLLARAVISVLSAPKPEADRPPHKSPGGRHERAALLRTGNLTDDPEVRVTPNGTAVANLTIATTGRRYDRQTQSWVDGDPRTSSSSSGTSRPKRLLIPFARECVSSSRVAGHNGSMSPAAVRSTLPLRFVWTRSARAFAGRRLT